MLSGPERSAGFGVGSKSQRGSKWAEEEPGQSTEEEKEEEELRRQIRRLGEGSLGSSSSFNWATGARLDSGPDHRASSSASTSSSICSTFRSSPNSSSIARSTGSSSSSSPGKDDDSSSGKSSDSIRALRSIIQSSHNFKGSETRRDSRRENNSRGQEAIGGGNKLPRSKLISFALEHRSPSPAKATTATTTSAWQRKVQPPVQQSKWAQYTALQRFQQHRGSPPLTSTTHRRAPGGSFKQRLIEYFGGGGNSQKSLFVNTSSTSSLGALFSSSQADSGATKPASRAGRGSRNAGACLTPGNLFARRPQVELDRSDVAATEQRKKLQQRQKLLRRQHQSANFRGGVLAEGRSVARLVKRELAKLLRKVQ